MSHEIKIEKKASEVIQPDNEEEARLAIRTRQDLSGARLRGMVLDNINAVGSILRKTDLTNADLSHGLLINPNFYKALLHGTAVHNTIILGGDLVKTNCKGADLSHSAIIGTDAQEASFEGAILVNAALVNTNLLDADFTRADLSNTRLASLDVTGADFSDANLSWARAYNINWEQAKVAPTILPEPLIKLPVWTWSVLVGSLFGFIALILYSLFRKKNNSR
jgi:uncharacterized protein YjbI with pentapeptide repeats